MGKMLLVIDVQEDFLDGGRLGVEGSRKMMIGLTDFIKENGMNYDLTVATVDWHPMSHCSFKDNGGVWPIHCVQHSTGAAIYNPILEALHKSSKFFTILTKGVEDDHEEYSIFKNEESRKKLVDLANKFGVDEIDVVGIALGYCVADTVKDGLRQLPNVKFNVIEKFCPSIPDGSGNEFIKFIEETERVELV